MLLHLELATTNTITLALASMVIQWWVDMELEIQSSPQYSVVWHDLWCHVLQSADTSLLGETKAQVVQMSTTNSAITINLIQYWDEVHGRELLVHTAEQLLAEVLPYATSVVNEYTFTMEVAVAVSKCITSLLYCDPF